VNASQESDLDRRLARDPIAIVGLSALYPKSRDLREFWGNVIAAADCIEDVPATHWDPAEHYDPDPTAPDKTYSKRGGFIPPVPFNPLEFGLPPNTMEVTDVLQLLSLVVARDVLKDAGADQPWYDSSRTGVVLGVTGANQLTQPLSARLQTPVLKEVVRSCGLSAADAEAIAEKFKLAFAPWEENSFPGMLGNVVAGRVANRLDLGGTNMTIDAACASSLAAVKAAVSELLERRSDMMITGGCDAENTIFMYLCFSKTPAFSKAGRIRPFDKDADGTLIGEGMGMLALRRLEDAERDGNRIYAVIRGIGSSSDGRFKSIYAPRKEGQIKALQRAYADADCTPATVELFEAHGTGTAVGDATELSALAAVVSGATDQTAYAAVGSVKSQIGHTKAAAGAAGLIKLALSLHHKVLPPTINVQEPSQEIARADSPFYVNTLSRPWIRDPKLTARRAAISSFGFGGTNFHIVLEEHGDGDDLRVLFPTARVQVWSAPDPGALADALESGAPAAAGPVPAGHARVALAARGQDEAAALRALAAARLRAEPEAAQWAHPKGVYYRREAAQTGKVGALFAGQGSQYPDLGRTAVLALPPLRAAFDLANRQFEAAEPLSRIAFPPPAFDRAARTVQEERLRRTEYAQPAIGALSAGQYRYLSGLGFAADGYLGHSFGELTALWAAGALSDADFFALARARGAAMAPPADANGADTGAMAAVSASEDRIAALLAAEPDLAVCNRNAADQIVVGGASAAVDRLVAAAKAAGFKASRLPVSAAFHTPFVGHALDVFRRSVAAADLRAPRGPVFADTPGAVYGPDAAANRAVLTEQLINPVDFHARIEEMYAAGFRTFVEFGPKGVLTQLVGRILGDRPHHAVQLDAGPDADADLTLKRAVAQLVVLGLPIDAEDAYTAPPIPAPEITGITIMLNGINHVSAGRRAAYREAIESGARITLPAAPAPAATPVPAPLPEPAVFQPAALSAPLSAPPTPPAPAPVPEIVPDVAPPAIVHEPAVAAARFEAPPEEFLEDEHMAFANLPGTAPEPTAETGAALTERLPELIAEHLTLHEDYLNGQMESAHRMADLLDRAEDQGRTHEVVPGVAAVKEHSLAIGRAHLRVNEILRDLVGLEFGQAARPGWTAPQTPAAYEPEALALPTVAPIAVPSAPVAQTVPAIAPQPAPAPVAVEPTVHIQVEAPVAVQAPAVIEVPAVVQVPIVAPTPVVAAAPAPVVVQAPVAAPAPVVAAVVSGGPASAAVESALLDVVSRKTGYPAEMLELGMDVEADLGIDSIKRVEIMGVLQEQFPSEVEVGPEQLAELRTLGDIVEFTVRIASGSAAAVTQAPVAAPVVVVAPIAPVAPAAPVAPVAPAAPVAAAVVSAGPASAAVQAALLDVVSRKTGYPAEMLELGMDVEADLGIDSIKRVEIMGVLQEQFPSEVEVGPEQLAELRTLGDIVEFTVRIAGGSSTAVAQAPVATPVTVPIVAPAAPVVPVAAPAAVSGGPASAAVQAALLDVVSRKTGYPAEMLELGMDVEADLGIDSIKRVEIMGVLQEQFPSEVEVGPEQLAELRTLGDIVEFTVRIAGGSPAAVTQAPVAAPVVVAAPPASVAPAAPVVQVAAPAPAPVAAAVVSGGPASAAVQAALLDVVSRKTGYPAEMLELGMDVEADLGIDSIKRVEIMGVLQEQFPSEIEVGPEQLAELRTLGDIVEFTVRAGSPGIPVGTAVAAELQDAVSSAAAYPAPVPASASIPAAPLPPGIGRAQAALTTLPIPDQLVGAYPIGAGALLVDDGDDLVPALAARLVQTGWRVHVLRLPAVPARITGAVDHALTGWGVTELAARIEQAQTDRISLVVTSAAARADWAEGVRRLSHALLVAKHVVTPLTVAADTGRAAFVTVTRLDGAFGLTGTAPDAAPAGGLGGLVKTLAIEAPELFCRAVDLAPGLTGAAAASLVIEEIHDAAPEPVQVGRDARGRVGLTLAAHPLRTGAPAAADPPALTSEDLLVVTGGARGITARCVAELAAAYRPGLLLVGRTALEGEPAWARGVDGESALKAAAVAQIKAEGDKPTPKRVDQLVRAVLGEREITLTLAEVRAAGSRAEYIQADITDPAATAAALAPYAHRVTGLVHGAGVLADQLIANKKASEIERVFAAKLGGLRCVVDALPAANLRHVVLFTSVAGFFGNRGQSDYAMANEALNAWAAAWKREHPAARVTALNWGAWDSGMVSPQIKAVFRERGIVLIPAPTGAQLFTEQFAPGRGHDVVTVLGPTTPLSQRPAPAPAGPTVLERPLAALAAEPIVADHVVGDVPVLPAALALGWSVGAVERITGGIVRQVRDFAVHKGVVFDGTHDQRFVLEATPSGEGTTTEVVIRSTAPNGSIRPHYAAGIVLGGDPALEPHRPTVAGLPALGGGRDASGFYTDGTLFHGQALRGVRRVLAQDEARLVLECALPELRPAGGAFNAALYSPGAADLLLQAALVWMRLFRGAASLPLAIDRAELYQALPDGSPFLVVVEPAAASGTRASLTVTACSPDHRVLLRMVGVGLVSTPQLAAKFVTG
jgi:acyl transferase domain-containing protein/acyl carrier protein